MKPYGSDLFIIANSLTPYRQHFHARVVREMPEVRLHTIVTHEEKDRQWILDPSTDINIQRFGLGDSVTTQTRFISLLREWRKAGRIIRAMEATPPVAVVSLGYNDAGRLRIIRWCRRRRIPCFVWGDSNIRGDQAKGLKRFAKHLVVGWVLRSITGVLVCGRWGVDFFAQYGDIAGRAWLSPCEPDYGLIESMTADRISQFLTRFDMNPDRRRIVFSGRLVDVKRVDLAIRAFVAIAKERPEWDFVVAGDGPLRDLLARLVPPELAGRFIWTGFVNDAGDMAALYRASDVLILPSDYEPWALVVNEAAAAGMALICSDVVGAAAELVRENVNGFIFPNGDVLTLTNVLRLATDSKQIDRLKAGSVDVLRNWRTMADPVIGLRKAIESAYRTDADDA